TYTEADIWLGLAAPNGPVTPQYTTTNNFCKISADASTVTCTIPYQLLVGAPLGTTDLQSLYLMCPNGDREALTFFLETNAQLKGSSGPVTGAGEQSCTDFPTCLSKVPYWEVFYRCSFCQNTPPPSSTPTSTPSSTTPTPTPTSCEVGTAFGYGTNI